MAFNIQNLARASVSMQEPLTLVTNTAGVTTSQPGCFRGWNYYGVNFDVNGAVNGDSFATMLAANYFNSVSGQLQPTDLITLYSASQLAYMTVQVTTIVSGVVTIAPVGGVSGFDGALTAAALLGMNAAPIQVLPAPGAGYAYLIKNWSIAKQAGTQAFASGGALNLYYDNTRTTAAATAIPATALTTSAAAGIGRAGALAAFGVASALYVNTPIYLSNATGAFTTGDSTATLFIDFDIVPVL